MTSRVLDEAQCRESIDILKDTYHFEFVKEFRRGRYGVVLSMKNERRVSVAVKITSQPGKEETETWPRLLHPNIIPLYDCLHLRNGLTAFVMPQMKCSLIGLVKNETFRSKERSFHYVGKWMYHLLCGLNYLHRKHICHLDIRLGNELVSYKGTALLSNFRFLTCKDTVPEEEIGMSDIYVPPEVFHMESQYDVQKPEFNCKYLDLWGYGILCLEAFTIQAISYNPQRTYKSQRVPVWNGWDVDVKPFLRRMLLERGYLLGMLQNIYPSSLVDEDDVSALIQFVKQFINEKPNGRIKAKDGIKHHFLRSWNKSYIARKRTVIPSWV